MHRGCDLRDKNEGACNEPVPKSKLQEHLILLNHLGIVLETLASRYNLQTIAFASDRHPKRLLVVTRIQTNVVYVGNRRMP